MARLHLNNSASEETARHAIARELAAFLDAGRLREVFFADDTAPAPPMAYVTHFPRLSITLAGGHIVQVARNARIELLRSKRGHAVFVPGNAWNKPDWSGSVRVLTFLFGSKHIGISMVGHTIDKSAVVVVKTSIDGVYDRLTQNILNALQAFAVDVRKGPLSGLLTQALLQACLQRLQNPGGQPCRKAVRTYNSICVYVQENYAQRLTRASVSKHFGLASNHVSRLFRKEGMVRFKDYLNLVRISRAKYLLRKTKVSLKEVAASCGYSDLPYFCRVFRRIAKFTPSEYRSLSGSVRPLTHVKSARSAAIRHSATSRAALQS
jgi:AraC-like DNA-binding protein